MTEIELVSHYQMWRRYNNSSACSLVLLNQPKLFEQSLGFRVDLRITSTFNVYMPNPKIWDHSPLAYWDNGLVIHHEARLQQCDKTLLLEIVVHHHPKASKHHTPGIIAALHRIHSTNRADLSQMLHTV